MDTPFLSRTRTDTLVRGALDGLAARHRTYMNNIANVETPGFQPTDVPFEGQLRKIQEEWDHGPDVAKSTPHLSLEAVPAEQQADRVDENGVQMDRQLLGLAENTLTYEALTQSVKMRGELMRAVITEGRK